MATKKSNKALWIMLSLIVVILLVILLLPGCGNGSGRPTTDETTLVRKGDKAPDFTVTMFDGSEVSLSQLRGKVVLVNFWATWCPPCREELTHVQSELIDRFAGREFVFLPISRGESRAEVAAFREKSGYTFPMGIDSVRTVYDRFASNYIPRNFLIDARGEVIFTSVGYTPAEFDEMIETIEKALAKIE